MWEDLGPQVVTSLGNIEEGYDKTYDSAKRLNEVQYNNLGDGLKGMWREIQVSCLEPMQSQLMPKFNEIFQKIRDKMPQIKETVTNVFNKIADKIIYLIDNSDKIIPVITNVVKAFLAFKGLSIINDVFKNIGDGINLVKNGINIIKGLNIISGIGKIGSLFKGLFGIIVSGLTVIMAHPIIAGITIAIGLIILLWNKCEWFRNGVIAIWEALKVAFSSVCDFLKGLWDGLCQGFEVVINAFKVYFMFVWEVIKTSFEVVCGFLKQIWEGLCNVFAPILTPIIEGIKSLWQGICDFFSGICQAISNIWHGICDFLGGAWNTYCEYFKAVWGAILAPFRAVGDFLKDTWNGVCDFFSNIWNGIVEGIKGAWDSIKQPFVNVINFIKDIWDKIKEFIKLPHFSLEGEFSLSPPSVPHIAVDWYWNEGVFDSPTMLGNIGVGDAFNGQGSSQEAILKTRNLYAQIDKSIKEGQQPVYVVVNVDNKINEKKLGNVIATTVEKNISNRQLLKSF